MLKQLEDFAKTIGGSVADIKPDTATVYKRKFKFILHGSAVPNAEKLNQKLIDEWIAGFNRVYAAAAEDKRSNKKGAAYIRKF
jgi:hypothetical protein